MLARRLLPILISLLWVAGIHHCAFEACADAGAPAEQECPSHASDDPASHTEGTPCSISMIEAQGTALFAPVVMKAAPFFPITALAIFTLAALEPPQDFSSALDEPPFPQRPLSPLCIASNAPPSRA